MVLFNVYIDRCLMSIAVAIFSSYLSSFVYVSSQLFSLIEPNSSSINAFELCFECVSALIEA